MGNALIIIIVSFLLIPLLVGIGSLITFLAGDFPSDKMRKVSNTSSSIIMVLIYISGGIGVLLCFFLFGGSPLFGGDYYAPYFN